MKKFKDFIIEFAAKEDGNPEISKKELNAIEKELDSLFKNLKIDIEFTKHFHERLNDPRNGKQVTINELVGVYLSLYTKYGKKLSKTSGSEGSIPELVKSINTNINIPVQVEYDKNKREVVIVAKTLMRKKNWKTKDKKILTVESNQGD